MEHLNENQGRSPEKTKVNEQLGYWSMLGISVLIIVGCFYYLGYLI